MIGEEGVPAEWEIGRSGKALDFPNIVFLKIAVLVSTKLGSRERHRHLQDLTDLLTPYQDGAYEEEMETVKTMRDRILKEGMTDGNLTLIERKEASDVHQRLWLAALMRMMKRHGLLGETWIRG